MLKIVFQKEKYTFQMQFPAICCVVVIVFGICSSTSCTNISECKQFEVCGSDSQCHLRSLWEDYKWQDFVGALLLFIGAMIAAGGGIGGGGVFIPLLTLVVGMTAKQAIPISQATIFGGSLANLAFNVREKHPKRTKRSLIDYSIVMMFTPMLLAGTTIGVILNVVFPSWLVTSLLVVIMGYVSRRTTRKAMSSWNNENVAKLEREGSLAKPLEPMPSNQSSDSDNDSNNSRARLDCLIIFFVWAFVVLFTILKGSKAGGTSVVGIRSCSTTFWLLNGGMLVFLVLITLFLGWLLQKWSNQKQPLHDDYNGDNNDMDITWNPRTVISYPALSIVAGMVGGLLGIGGGMVLAPLLLEIGIHSRVVSATTATAVLITASSAIVQYLILGMLIPSYSIFYFLVGAIATGLGQIGFDFLVRKYQRPSILALSIALLIIVATILLLVSGILETIKDSKHGKLGFSSVC